MKQRAFVAILVSVAILFVVATASQATGPTREEWRHAIEQRIELLIHWHYARLGKTFTDVPLIIGMTVQSRAADMLSQKASLHEIIESQINVSRADIPPAKRDSAIRIAYLMKQQADFFRSDAEYNSTLWESLNSIRRKQCSTESIGEFSKYFSISAAANVKADLEHINAQIESIIKDGGNVPASIDVDWTIPVGPAKSSDSGLSYKVLVSPSIKGGVPAGLTSIATTAGTTLGSAIGGPVGACIGGALGDLVGRLLCNAIFGSPMKEWLDLMQTQRTYILDAVDDLSRQGPQPFASAACEKYVGNNVLQSLYHQVDLDIKQALSATRDAAFAFDEDYQSIQKSYKEELDRCLIDAFPMVEGLITKRFEEYFKDVERRSNESKIFANRRLTPFIKKFLQSDSKSLERFNSEQDLWDMLIDGEAGFSRAKDFAFVAGASDEVPSPELIYWDIASKAVMNKLASVLSAEQPKGAQP